MTARSSADPRYGSPQQPEAAAGGQESMKDKATGTVQTGQQAAGQVAQSAAEQAKEVGQEARAQARNLVGEARDQVRGQAGTQQRQAANNLHSLGDQLRSMASSGQEGQVATDLVRQAADRAHGVAAWLEQRQPEDVLDELRRFARRRPGAFLFGAAAAGVLAGRLTRGAVESHRADGSSGGTSRPLPGTGSAGTLTGGAGDYGPSMSAGGQHPHGSTTAWDTGETATGRWPEGST